MVRVKKSAVFYATNALTRRLHIILIKCLLLLNSCSAVSNFVDLSGISRSEGTVFDKLLQRLYERRTTYIPIKFLSLARNSLSRAPYSSLYLVGSTLEYLSMAGNNFSILSSTTIRGE